MNTYMMCKCGGRFVKQTETVWLCDTCPSGLVETRSFCEDITRTWAHIGLHEAHQEIQIDKWIDQARTGLEENKS